MVSLEISVVSIIQKLLTHNSGRLTVCGKYFPNRQIVNILKVWF